MAKKKVPKPNATYVIPKLEIPASSTVMVGMDPGSRNFGISVVGLLDGKITVYANSVLTNPLCDLVDFNTSSTVFMAEINRWFRALKQVHGLTAERFQTRGPGGPLIEYVSTMIGLVRGHFRGLHTKLTIASTWKNAFNKVFESDLKEIYPTTLVQPHQLDATLIAIYGLEELIGEQIDYDIEDVIAQTERTSLVKLRKPR